MYKALISFVMNKNVYEETDVKKGEILPENFASQDIINDLLESGHIAEYDGSIEITENGTYDVKEYESADVNVLSTPVALQSKDVTITENGETTVTADSGYDGLRQVNVTTNVSGGGADDYFNTEITNNTSSSSSAFLQIIKKIPALTVRGTTELRNAFSYSSVEEIGKITTTGLSKVQSFQSMFYSCSKLAKVDFSGIDFSGTQILTGMFNGCSALTSLDLSNLNSSSITAMVGTFYNCTSLMYLDIRNQDFTYITNVGDTFKGVPANCEIIVKDQANKDWILNQRSDFTNIKTVAEL